jgi:transposase InsO family protein
LPDNGTRAGRASFDFRDTCRDLGLRHIRTKPYTPKTNREAERFIQTALGWPQSPSCTPKTMAALMTIFPSPTRPLSGSAQCRCHPETSDGRI